MNFLGTVCGDRARMRLGAGGSGAVQRLHSLLSRSCLQGTYWHTSHTTPYFFQRMPQALQRGWFLPMSLHKGVLVHPQQAHCFCLRGPLEGREVCCLFTTPLLSSNISTSVASSSSVTSSSDSNSESPYEASTSGVAGRFALVGDGTCRSLSKGVAVRITCRYSLADCEGEANENVIPPNLMSSALSGPRTGSRVNRRRLRGAASLGVGEGLLQAVDRAVDEAEKWFAWIKESFKS